MISCIPGVTAGTQGFTRDELTNFRRIKIPTNHSVLQALIHENLTVNSRPELKPLPMKN